MVVPVKPEGTATLAEPNTTPELEVKSLVIVIVYVLVSPGTAEVGEMLTVKT
jgi:hypothetical protein